MMMNLKRNLQQFPAVQQLLSICEIQPMCQPKMKASDNNDVALNNKRQSGSGIDLHLIMNARKANNSNESNVLDNKIKSLRCTLISSMEMVGKNQHHCPKDGTSIPRPRSSILATPSTTGATRTAFLCETMSSAEPTPFMKKNFQFLKINFKPPMA